MEDTKHCQAPGARTLACFLAYWMMLASAPGLGSQAARAEVTGKVQTGATHNSKSALFETDILRIAQNSKQRAEALAEKVIDKLGGLEKIKKFNNIAYRAKGNVEQISSMSGSSNTLPCEIVAQGHKQWVSVTFMGQPVVTGYDGKQCWTIQGKNVMPTDPITAKRVKEDLDHGLLLVEKLLDRGRKLKLEEGKVINGINCEALSAVADDGKPTTFYIDPDTSLIVRTEYHGADIEQGVDCVKAYDYFDYRKVAGTLQPFKAIEYSDQKKVSVVEITSLETDVKLPDNFFRMPEESKIARLKEGPVRVPFQFTSNEILVMASINGLPNKLFIVDTGATQSIVDTACFKDIAPNTSEEIAITTGSGAMKMGFAQLKSFQIGDIVINDVPVAIADLSRFSQFLAVKPQGLIGANILKRFLITIDYDKRELVLQDPDRGRPPQEAVVVESKPSLGVSGLAVEGVIDGKLKLSFLIDSGAAFNHVAESLIKDLTTEPLLPVGVIKGLDGTPVRTGAIRFKSLELGKLKIDEPVFSVAPSKQNDDSPRGIISGGALAIIGNPLLSRYRVTIDYRNQRIYFEETVKKAEAELENRLRRILAQFYNENDARATTNQLSHLASDALAHGCTPIAALAMANEALNMAQHRGSAKAIQDRFLTAFDHARHSDKKPVMAQVLSLWAQHYLQSNPENLSRARPLINKAIATCPTEPSVYAVYGLYIASVQASLKNKKPDSATAAATTDGPAEVNKIESSADVMLNQSLMLDPANWLALWTKYALAERSGKTEEKTMIAKHLRRYYPESIRVKQLAN